MAKAKALGLHGIVQKGKKKLRKSLKKESSSATINSNPIPRGVVEKNSQDDTWSDNQSEVNADDDSDASSYNKVTVFNVEVEDSPAGMEAPVAQEETTAESGIGNSKAEVITVEQTVTAAVSENKDAVSLILLLLDGRRFELLQL